MKVALVHEFLTQYGGAERVLDCFLEMWPDATIHTLIYDEKKMGRYYGKAKIKTSFLQNWPSFPPAGYKWWLALYPKAIEQFDFSGYDLVLSDSSAFAKGVITRHPTMHISYIHTPTRYLWSVTKEYLENAPIPKIIRPFMPPFINYLRSWDFKAAKRPDYMIANSENVAHRIKKFYRRNADEIIFPYVDCSRFTISKNKKKYWLTVGRQEPYKKTDLAIYAANKLGIDLVVVGSGTHMEEFKKIAGPTVTFTGRLSDKEIAKVFEDCIGFIFPPEEDAGITPLEAMAAGRPVIAYAQGGALESIIPGTTGEFFNDQTVESLVNVLKKFNPNKYDSELIRARAKEFDKEIFMTKIKNFINEKIS